VCACNWCMRFNKFGGRCFDHVAVMTVHMRVNGDVAVREVSPLTKVPSKSLYRTVFKRALDVGFILLALPVVGPMILIMALLAALDGHNPFYSQLRVGKDGRIFRLWKIRTMTIDADDRLAAYLKANPAANEEWEKHQKLKKDPRITPIGRLLRKTSLDELPQLINVLQGSMSLVGPRPMMPEQEKYYYGSAYYTMRPGITGFWQISDRNESSFCGRVGHDDAYSERMSFGTDISTLLKTVLVVFKGTGY